MKEYLRYLLLSKNFLGLISYLSSGKEHPRINSYDLESIEIPLPSDDGKLTKQGIVVELIEEKLGDINQKWKVLENKRGKIEELISVSLK